ncbi:MAG: HD domain-containing protein [Planctomycetes bacterium]|nr:HD domain-containing protein [Planctomycetota bacterium]
MKDYSAESLSHDPLHGYIRFTSPTAGRGDEVTERELIDHAWLQRLRQIHQLQTAWWVFPTAEHTRFQHVLGVMHLASQAAAALDQSLREQCADVPSRGYVESLLRVTGLLHDVGHGPFGHFFDEHFLRRFGLTHETLGAHIIRHELGDLIRGIRRNPNSSLEPGEQLDPEQVAFLITRPGGIASNSAASRGRKPAEASKLQSQPESSDTKQPPGADAIAPPRWLVLLRSLFCGIYTVDNMDFVLRDAFMSGYSTRAFDLQRLLHYTFFSERGLTVHDRGLDSLVRFMTVRAELFRSVYFHRTVRAIDLSLADLFAKCGDLILPGDPREHLDEYRRLTEWSLLVDVAGWNRAADERRRQLAGDWEAILSRKVPWKMLCQRHLVFGDNDVERSSIFSDAVLVERQLRQLLPAELKDYPLRVDVARHIYRPHTAGPAEGQNFLYESSRGRLRSLTDDALFRRLPASHRICRVYATASTHRNAVAAALDELLGGGGGDDLTNM